MSIVPYAYFEQQRQFVLSDVEQNTQFVLDHRNLHESNWQCNCLYFESYSVTLDEYSPQYFSSDIFTVASALHNADVFEFYAHNQQACFPFDITCWLDAENLPPSNSDSDFVHWLINDFCLQSLLPTASRFDRLKALNTSRNEIHQYIYSCSGLSNDQQQQRLMALAERYIRWRYVYCLLALDLVYSLGEYLFSPKPFIYSRITGADDLFAQYTRIRYVIEKNVETSSNPETLTYVWWLLKTTNDAYKSHIDIAKRSENAVCMNAAQLELLLIYRFLAMVHIRPHLGRGETSPPVALIRLLCNNRENASESQFSAYARWFQTSMLTWFDCYLPDKGINCQVSVPFYPLLSFDQPVLLTMRFDLRLEQNDRHLNRHKQSAYAFRLTQESFRSERHQQYAPWHCPVIRLLRDHCTRKKAASCKTDRLSEASVVGWLKRKSYQHYTSVPNKNVDRALKIGDVLALLIYHNNHCNVSKIGYLKFAYYDLARVFRSATKMHHHQPTKTIWLRKHSFLRPLLPAYRRYIALLRDNGKKNSLYHVRLSLALSSTPILHDLLERRENNV